MKSITFLFLVLLIISSCSQSAKQVNYENLRQEAESSMKAYVEAIMLANLDSTLSYWTDDLMVFRPSGEISGKQAFRKMLEPVYQGLKVNQLMITSRNIDIADRIAIEVTEYSQNLSMDGAEPIDVNGKYVAIWVKETTGTPWKIQKMITMPQGKDDIHD